MENTWIIANLVKTEELREYEGKPVTTLNVITAGNEKGTYYEVSVWGEIANWAHKSLRPGMTLRIEGRAKPPRVWMDKDGNVSLKDGKPNATNQMSAGGITRIKINTTYDIIEEDTNNV